MTSVLVLKTSILGRDSVSNGLIQQFVQRVSAAVPQAHIRQRDFATETMPQFEHETLQALMREAGLRSPVQRELVAYADQLVSELQAADLLVIGAPMYNFTVPATLKSWIDHVARAGVTFKYTEKGAVGLLDSKQVVVFTTMGGRHEPGKSDHVRPYLETVLGFLGLDRVEMVVADGLNLGEESRRQSLESARKHLDAVAARVTGDLRQSEKAEVAA